MFDASLLHYLDCVNVLAGGGKLGFGAAAGLIPFYEDEVFDHLSQPDYH